ncbi:MAG: FecR family protein [Myxococcota bacterium]
MAETPDRDPLPSDLLGAWELPEPPAGFADRVLARTHPEEQDDSDGWLGRVAAARPSSFEGTPKDRRWRLVLGLAVAAAVILVGFVRPSWPMEGERTIVSRASVSLGDRGVAVAEAGSSLRWSVDWLGRVAVEQTRGRVFYRVDPGGRFEVHTPHGEVVVTGTCFDVDAYVGTRVAVYEGDVVVSNEHGQLTLAPGDEAYLERGHGPRVGGPRSSEASGGSGATERPEVAERSEVAARSEAAGGGGVRASARPAVEEPAPTGSTAGSELEMARQCAENGDCSRQMWVEPTIDQLRELGRCGRVLVDTPSFMADDFTFTPAPESSALALLSESEHQALEKTARTFHRGVGERLEPLLGELGMGSALIERLSPAQRLQTALALVDPALKDDVRRLVSRERAGWVEAPEDLAALDPGERVIRLYYGLGTEYEQRLAAELGAEVAGDLRGLFGGWLEKSSESSGGCRDLEPSGVSPGR